MASNERKTRLAAELLHEALGHIRAGAIDRALKPINKALRYDPQNEVGFLLRGECHAKRGQPDLAYADYSEAIRLRPDLAHGYAARGRLQYDPRESWRTADKQYLKDALADCEKALELDPRSAEAYLACASIRRQLLSGEIADEDWDRIRADLDAAVDCEPEWPEAYSARGHFWYDTYRDCDKALMDYDRAIELDPDNPEYNWLRSQVYRHVEDFERVVVELTEGLRKPQNDGMIYCHLLAERGRAFEELGRFREAEADYRKGRRVCSDRRYRDDIEHWRAIFDDSLDTMARREADDHIARRLRDQKLTIIRELNASGELVRPVSREDICEAVRAATQPDPLDVKAHAIKLPYAIKRPATLNVEVDCWLGPTIVCQIHVVGTPGKGGGAGAAEAAPADTASLLSRARRYAEAGDLDAAIADLNDAVDLAPADPDVLFERGTVLSRRDCTGLDFSDRKQAEADLSRVIESRPDWTQAYIRRAHVYGELVGDSRAAIRDLEQAVHLDPNEAAAHGMLGFMLNRKCEYQRAIGPLDKAIRLEPDHSAFHRWRGEARYCLGDDMSAAERDFLRALELGPPDDEAVQELHGRLGVICEKRGDYAAALSHYERALAASPDGAYHSMYESKIEHVKSKL